MLLDAGGDHHSQRLDGQHEAQDEHGRDGQHQAQGGDANGQHDDGDGEGDDHRLPDRQTARGDMLALRASRQGWAGLCGLPVLAMHGPFGVEAGTGTAGRPAAARPDLPELRRDTCPAGTCLPCLPTEAKTGEQQGRTAALENGPCQQLTSKLTRNPAEGTFAVPTRPGAVLWPGWRAPARAGGERA